MIYRTRSWGCGWSKFAMLCGPDWLDKTKPVWTDTNWICKSLISTAQCSLSNITTMKLCFLYSGYSCYNTRLVLTNHIVPCRRGVSMSYQLADWQRKVQCDSHVPHLLCGWVCHFWDETITYSTLPVDNHLNKGDKMF